MWCLEQELQSELDEPWRVQLAAHDAEARIIRCAASGVRWAKLHTIESVEELGPELQTELVLRSEVCGFKYRDVPVIDSLPSQGGIDATLVTETPVGRRRETARIEPRNSSREGRMRHGLVTSGDIIRAQNTDSQQDTFMA